MELEKNKSSIRSKIIWITLVSIVFSSVFIFIFSDNFLLNRFSSLEKDQVITNINRAEDFLGSIIENQSTKIKDWSSWDDTYTFIKDKNKDYVISNLGNESILSLHLNMMVFLDDKDEIVLLKFIDSNTKEDLPEGNITSYINSNISIIKNKTQKENLRNIIRLPEGDMLVSSAPILRSDGTGPSSGTLIFGAFIDKDMINGVSKRIHEQLDLYSYDNPTSPSMIKAKNYLSSSSPYFVNTFSDRIIEGYSLLYDIKDKPIVILKVDTPRDIYSQGKSTSNTLLLSIIIIIIMLGISLVLFLNKFFLSRIINLGNEIKEISDSQDFDKKISENGNDEIGSLAIVINNMLRKIVEVNNKEKTINQTEKEMIEKDKKHIEEVDSLNKLMVDRELKMIELKKENLRLKNKEEE